LLTNEELLAKSLEQGSIPSDTLVERKNPVGDKVLRRSRSSGHLATLLPEKTLAHPRKASDKREEILSTDLTENLSKISDKNKSNGNSSRKGSSQSVSSASGTATKSSLREKGRSKKKGAMLPTSSSKEKAQEVTIDDLQNACQLGASEGRLDHSTASLDPDLLTNSPSVPTKVACLNEIFNETGGASVSKDDPQGFSSSSSSCGSSEEKQNSLLSLSDGNPQDDTRVRWLELPLHDPKQLLIKSADFDGTNETCVTQDMEEVSMKVTGIAVPKITESEHTHSQPRSRSKESKGAKKGRQNPSLQDRFSRENARIKTDAPQDERTVATYTTTNTSATNASEATAKTTNIDRSVTKVLASKSRPGKRAMDEPGCADNGHESLTMEQLSPTEQSDEGSSGSLSRSSRRSKGSESSTSISGKSMERRKSRRPSNSYGEVKERTRDRSSRQERSIDTRPQRRKPDHRDRHQAAGVTINGVGKENPHRSEKANVTADQARGEPTEEITETSNTGRPLLQRKISVRSEAGSLVRRKSYLPHRKSKAEKAESKEQRSSVDSSLETFLKRIEQAAPVEKDDNRSVYSSMQEKDRNKRSRDKMMKKNGEKIYPRRVRRDLSTTPLERALERGRNESEIANDANNDTMSVNSAPLLRYSSRPSQVSHDDLHRPVVNLKKTQFSNKLTKLHVAF
jgi:hypothetical protein